MSDPARVGTLDFDALYREQRGRVLAAVRTVLGPSDEVEDVVQQTFLEIFKNLATFEQRSSLSTWIYRVALNVSLQHLRSKRRRRWLVLGPTGDEMARERSPRDDARRVEHRDALAKVYEAADTLPEKKRTVWVLHELQGLEPREIAEILDIPMNTVRSRLLAARAALMDELRRRGVVGGGEGP